MRDKKKGLSYIRKDMHCVENLFDTLEVEKLEKFKKIFIETLRIGSNNFSTLKESLF